MGYIFDALNRGAQPPEDGQPGSASPTPDTPRADAPAPETPEPAETPEPQAAAPSGDVVSAALEAAGPAIDLEDTDALPGAPPESALPEDFEASPPMIDDAPLAFGPAALDAPEGLTGPDPIVTDRRVEINEHRLRTMDDRIVMLCDPGCQFAEEYRAIRTSLVARWQNKRNLVHVITSATPQEGKTITSLNLGLTLAELRNRRTIIIEADLRLPAFDKLLKLDPGPGLVRYLRGEASLDEATQRVGEHGAYMIAAGDRAFDDAVALLSGGRMQSLITELRKKFDHVVIDTPPVIELADAGVLGGMSDDVLLIARMRRTSKRLIEQAIRTLNSYNAPVGGLIATDHPHGLGRYYNYRYRYGYRYSRYRDYRRKRKAA